MAGVSRFSTQDNLTRINDTIEKLNEAIKEIKIAQQAGVPTMDAQLKIAEEALSKAEAFKHTYFPLGTAPTQ